MPFRSRVLARAAMFAALVAWGGQAASQPQRAHAAPATAAVQAYIETRDRFILELEDQQSLVEGQLLMQAKLDLLKPEPGRLVQLQQRLDRELQQQDERALAQLEQQLIAIIGPVAIEGFDGRAKINLQTLQQEGGFDMLDGLRLQAVARTETLVVTTQPLLDDYLARHPDLPTGLKDLSGSGDFYFRTFDWETAVSVTAELPVRLVGGQSYVRAFLGLLHQDIGPFTPQHLYVFVVKDQRVLLMMAQAQVSPAPIERCVKAWEAKAGNADDLRKRLQAAANDDERERLADERGREDELSFAIYLRCYGREARGQAFFAPLTAQAQAMVDRLR